MRVLMISSDPSVFQQGSPAEKRFQEYQWLVDRLFVVVIAGSGNVRAFWKAYRDGRCLIRQEGPINLITCQDPAERWVVAYILSLRFHIPLQLQVHTDMFSPYFWREHSKNKIRVLIARWLLPRAAGIRVVSKRIQTSLVDRGINPRRIAVLPVLVDVPALPLQNREVKEKHDFTFLMISRLTHEKDIALALEAFAEVVRRHPRAKLVIVGSGPDETYLEAEVVRREVEDHVRFIGSVPHENLGGYYAMADCFLLTSLYEGYGMAVVEAMAARLPVIMTDVGIAGDLVRHNETGLVVPVGDAIALAMAMERMIENPQFRGALAVTAEKQARAALLSRDTYLKKYRESWQTCIAVSDNDRMKLCYILPESNADTATHFYYKQELLSSLVDDLDIRAVSMQKGVRGIIAIFRARLSGIRTFYVHYSFKGALAALTAAALFGGKVFYWNCGMPWLYRRGFIEEWLFRFILRHTIFVTGTRSLLEEYRRRYGVEAGRILPNSIDIMRFCAVKRGEARRLFDIPEGRKVVLFAHRLSRRKGVYLIPEIMQRFYNRNDVLFILIGDGPERNALTSYVTHSPLSDNVRMVGAVPNKDMAVYFAAADIFIMPSEEEGMPHALLDAMAAGVPFIAFDVGGVRETAAPWMQRFILPGGDVDRFAGMLEELLSFDKVHIGRIASDEREWVKRYNVSLVRYEFISLVTA